MSQSRPFAQLRADIPLLSQPFNGSPLIYFDNAATTHKPYAVIDALSNFYTSAYASTGRGVYTLAEQATGRYEAARHTVAAFLGAQCATEIIFTHGATDGINMLAYAWARAQLCAGDEIVISALEHHANLLVWQQLAAACAARLVIVPVAADGRLDMHQAEQLIGSRTKLVAICHVSNMLGTQLPIKQFAALAHKVGARLLVDASQSVPHGGVNVQELGCDMLLFSGHKIMGPTGIGIAYIARDLHEQIRPYQFGGGMVYTADYHHATWREMPYRLEAGTPPVAQAIGLAAALDYFTTYLDVQAVHAHEAALTAHLIEGLQRIPGIRILGPVDQLRVRGHLVSFVCDTIHAHDVAAYLNLYNICVRAGHHCAQPLAQSLGSLASVRVSFYWYNTHEEVDRLLELLAALMAKV